MKNFEAFTNAVVALNSTDTKGMNAGLGAPNLPNRVTGDKAEQYIIRKLKKLNYEGYITPGSKSPADIFAVKRRKDYWHIMLIQVKSSTDSSKIKRLNNLKINELQDFGQFVKKQLKHLELMKSYRDKAVLITTGYVGVHSSQNSKQVKNIIKSSELFSFARSHFSSINLIKAKEVAKVAHEL